MMSLTCTSVGEAENTQKSKSNIEWRKWNNPAHLKQNGESVEASYFPFVAC